VGRVRRVVGFLGRSSVVVSLLVSSSWSVSLGEAGLQEPSSLGSLCLAAALFGSPAWSFWYRMYFPSLTETPRTGEISFLESERLG
jgi:hypothetical protein